MFSFSEGDEITEVVHEMRRSPIATDEVPLVIRGLVNDALGNNTPMCLAYVSEDSEPVLSLACLIVDIKSIQCLLSGEPISVEL